MHTLNLRVDDSIFDYVKTMLDGFIKDKITSVKKFEKELDDKIKLLIDSPFLKIFKWQNR